MNLTLHKFICDFIKELKRENEMRYCREEDKLDIPFIISSLYQSFENNEDKYQEFISYLENHDYFLDIINRCGYNEIITLAINSYNYDNYKQECSYEIHFFYDERLYGYCECTPDMPDYREDKKCCGHGCDAYFCGFELNKVIRIESDIWQSDEHDYWEFEESFYKSEQELLEEKERERKEREIQELKNRIKKDTERLKELEG